VRCLLFALCFVPLVGCGDGTLEVRGKVTFDGKAVESGTITFEPEDRNGPSRGGPITKGEYRVTAQDKMTPGAKVVRIQSFGPSGKKVSAAPGSTTMVDEFKQHIPAQYNTNSTLKATVEAGKENVFDFDLKP